MNLQALTFTGSKFNNLSFDIQFTNGWLKNYYYSLVILLIANIGNAFYNLSKGLYFMGNPTFKDLFAPNPDGTYTIEYYNTFFYGVSLIALAVAALVLTLGLFFQFQAIRTRSLEIQDTTIKVATLFIFAQSYATGANIFLALVSGPISKFAAFTAGFVFLAVGVGFKLLASKVKNIMLGQNERKYAF